MSTYARIRRAKADDVDSVQACARAAYAKYVERIGREPAPMVADFARQIELGVVRVAEVESSVVGYVVYFAEGDHIHLENIAVHPTHAGSGIGRRLMEHVEQEAMSGGFAAVELYTNEAMTENLSLYPKLGYLETDRRRQDGFDRVFFRKNLRSQQKGRGSHPEG